MVFYFTQRIESGGIVQVADRSAVVAGAAHDAGGVQATVFLAYGFELLGSCDGDAVLQFYTVHFAADQGVVIEYRWWWWRGGAAGKRQGGQQR
ncbi:hypothetical protein D3C79_933810 [compost metagenome]